jgi:tripartite-type tricarboxylate transporter receptor subunit TctC
MIAARSEPMKRLLAAATFTLLACNAFAAAYPEKPVRLVLPYGPGGGSDVVARPLAHFMSERTGAQFIADNRGGANGNIAMEIVAHAPADGYTLVLALTAQLAINPSLYKKIPYDPVKDFAPVTLLGSAPYFLSVNRTLQANTLAEFIKLARDKPGGLTYASTGNGSGLHLSMELLKSMAKIDLVHVPYKSAGIAITDLLAGQVQAQFISYGTGVGHFKAGRLRALAATTKERSRALPDVPTIAEAGVPGYESGVWYALLAPRGTPQAVIKRLHADCVELAKGPLAAQLINDGITPIVSSPAELAAYTKSEIAKWAEVVKRSGATVD